MAILELASNISSLLDLVTVLIGVAIAGYGVKVKFISAAEKYAAEVEEKRKADREELDKLKKEFYDYRLQRAERRQQDRDWNVDQDRSL